MEHTAGPWVINENGDEIIRADHGDLVAFVEGIEQKDLKFIVRACNSHDELLAACKEFVRKVECGKARSKRSYAQMKAAIAHAEEE